MKYKSDYKYFDRSTKAKYVWLKYGPILKGRSILDVGADECYLKKYIGKETQYFGIGLGGKPDLKLNLEREKIPFEKNSYDCVLCLDVLEHVENIHGLFDEICRVTRNFLIISLPNPHGDFWRMITDGDYRTGVPMKFYGLTVEKPNDRHKWFYSPEEAEYFIYHRAAKNNMRVEQIDYYGNHQSKKNFRNLFRTIAMKFLLRKDLNYKNIFAGTLWAVMKKKQ